MTGRRFAYWYQITPKHRPTRMPNESRTQSLLRTMQLLRKIPCSSIKRARPTVRNHSMTRVASVPSNSAALLYTTPGDIPGDVLQLTEVPVAACGPTDIVVQFLLSPINPSDVNTVQGKYPIQPTNGIPGHEGVGRVIERGSEVTSHLLGDIVVPLLPALGTWRKMGTYPAEHFHVLPPTLPLEAAATLCINPPSALGMLEGFVKLQPGDTVVQNGANSAVGQLMTLQAAAHQMREGRYPAFVIVIQLCKLMGVRTVNIIRDRPDWDNTVSLLKGLGADVVTTEAKLKADMAASGLKKPLLGLNCIGGTAAFACAKIMGDGGTLVTYGGMSMQPVQAPVGLMIFNDITYRGFWLSGRLSREQGLTGRAAALDRLTAYIMEGKLVVPSCKTYPLEEYKEALAEATSGFKGNKILLKP